MVRLKPTHGPLWHGASSCVNSHHFSSIVTTEWVRTAGVFRCKLPTFDNPLEHAYVARAWWKATGVQQRHPNEMPCHPVSDSSELRYTGRMSIWGQVEHQTTTAETLSSRDISLPLHASVGLSFTVNRNKEGEIRALTYAPR